MVHALQADGYSVWWDAQIGGGTAWRHSIETELNAAKCVVIVSSNRSPCGPLLGAEPAMSLPSPRRRHFSAPRTAPPSHLLSRPEYQELNHESCCAKRRSRLPAFSAIG